MKTRLPLTGRWLPILLLILGFGTLLLPSWAEEISVIGQIESLYRGRVSMRVIEVPGDASGTASLKEGDRVSFNLPKASNRRDKRSIEFGNVIEADLVGNVATEYADAGSETTDSTDRPGSTASEPVLLWTAQRADRVKNPRKYLDEDPGKDKEGGKDKKGRKGRKGGKDKEAPQIWTQEEAVSGKVAIIKQRAYIREDRLRPRDKGLDVLSDEWYEKLKPYVGQKVVVQGVTHRVSISSGTIEIKSVMKIYPK